MTVRFVVLALLTARCVVPYEVLTTPDAGSGIGGDGLAAGWFHTCALRSGTLWCWGRNDDGQLGVPMATNLTAPQRVGTATSWVEATAGWRHSCARNTAGEVWCWGSNEAGQLGTGAGSSVTPVKVSLPAAAVKIDAEERFSCALLRDASVWCWGYNQEGGFGQGDVVDRMLPVQVPSDAGFIDVSTGQGHLCAIERPGTLWCVGRNSLGQLGLGAGAPPELHALAQVGAARDWSAVDVNQNFSCALRSGGTWWCWGQVEGLVADGGVELEPTQVDSQSGWGPMRSNCFNGCGQRSDGATWCFGRNVEGELATGDNGPRAQAVRMDTEPWTHFAVGRQHVCGARGSGVILCTGKNDYGQLGVDDGPARTALREVPFP